MRNINIKRSYFNNKTYKNVIDNSFKELISSQDTAQDSISDFLKKYERLLADLPNEAHDFFYNESKELTPDFTGSDEVSRLNDLISSSLDKQNREEEGEAKEHPIVPNGSFFSTGGDIVGNNGKKGKRKKAVVSLDKGVFYYMQNSFLRKIDGVNTFKSIFKSITNQSPTDANALKNYVPYIFQETIDSFPKGRLLTANSLGNETQETPIDSSIPDTSGTEGSILSTSSGEGGRSTQTIQLVTSPAAPRGEGLTYDISGYARYNELDKAKINYGNTLQITNTSSQRSSFRLIFNPLNTEGFADVRWFTLSETNFDLEEGETKTITLSINKDNREIIKNQKPVNKRQDPRNYYSLLKIEDINNPSSSITLRTYLRKA